MQRPILVINAGSSSLKFSIFESHQGSLGERLHGAIDNIGRQSRLWVEQHGGPRLEDRRLDAADHAAAIGVLHDWFAAHVGDQRRLAAAGHRVVHGGVELTVPTRIDDAVIARLEALIPLAPLHQPHHLAAIRALRAAAPELPQVACFDTAFHATQPWLARAFALPRRFDAEGLQRYGFHGLSYESIVAQLRGIDAARADGRLVVAHLGNGASLCAIRQGRSVATTMGLTPLDGVPMSTRCGALDPGVLLYLMRQHGMNAEALEDLLYHHSGLLGVSGISGDLRELAQSAQPAARQAIALFVYHIARAVGSLSAALQGLDTLVFTGGIGEHQAPVRAAVCDTLGWLGVTLDAERNARGDGLISADGSSVRVYVLATDENLVVAEHTLQRLDA